MFFVNVFLLCVPHFQNQFDLEGGWYGVVAGWWESVSEWKSEVEAERAKGAWDIFLSFWVPSGRLISAIGEWNQWPRHG